MQKFTDTLIYLVHKNGLNGAIKHFNKQYTTIEEPGLGDQITYYKSKQLAYYEFFHYDYNKIGFAICLSFTDSILNLIEKNEVQKLYQRQYTEANFSKGDLLYQMHQYEPALSYYFKGKTMMGEITNDCDKAAFTDRFALVDYKEGKFTQAASLFTQEFNQRSTCEFNFENFAATQGSINNAGICYMALGMSDSAIYCFNKNLAYVNRYANQFPLNKRFITDIAGVRAGFYGNAYYDKGENEKAEAYLKESIKLNGHGGNEGKNAQKIALLLGRLYLTSGQIKQADSMASRIKLSLDTLYDDANLLAWEKLKADYYSFINEPQKSRTYMDAYLKLKANDNQVKHSMIENDVDNYFTDVQKKYDQTIIKNEKQLRILQLVLFIGFSLLILFIMYQFWNNWRRARRNNIALQSTLSVLQQSQEENNRLMKVVAHDLRSPISSMFSLTSLLLESPERSSYDKTVMELIKTSSQNCIKLVSELLNPKIEKDELKNETVDLAKMLNFCVDQLTPKATEKNQRIVLYIQPCYVAGNSEKLWRVMSNLIGNAIKFSPESSTITVKLEVAINGAVIAVKDTGIGIPEELKKDIFNMNSSAGRLGTGGEQSFGMGLAISKQIIEAHGGRLWFESEAGVGSTFYVELING